MPDELIDGRMYSAIAKIKGLLESCFYWQSISPEDGQGLVYIDELPAPENGHVYTREEFEAMRPFAIVAMASGDGFEMSATTSQTLMASGRAHIEIELPVPEDIADDGHLVGQHVLKTVGRILHTGSTEQPGIFDLSGTPGRPYIRKLVVQDYYRVIDEKAEQVGDHVLVSMELEWGYRG